MKALLILSAILLMIMDTSTLQAQWPIYAQWTDQVFWEDEDNENCDGCLTNDLAIRSKELTGLFPPNLMRKNNVSEVELFVLKGSAAPPDKAPGNTIRVSKSDIPEGLTIRVFFDGNGYIIEEHYFAEQEYLLYVNYSHDSTGKIVWSAIGDISNSPPDTTDYFYNLAGQLVKEKDRPPVINGTRIDLADSLVPCTKYKYDAHGRIVKISSQKNSRVGMYADGVPVVDEDAQYETEDFKYSEKDSTIIKPLYNSKSDFEKFVCVSGWKPVKYELVLGDVAPVIELFFGYDAAGRLKHIEKKAVIVNYQMENEHHWEREYTADFSYDKAGLLSSILFKTGKTSCFIKAEYKRL